jgi:hypothetical protein
MKKNKILVLLLTVLFLTSSCGYKALNVDNNNFKIDKIKITGNKRAGFQIKNQILSYTKKNSNRVFNLEINLKKNKLIKEKDITNKVTKYNLQIEVDVDILIKSTSSISKFSKVFLAEYLVAKSHSATIQNEKTALENLSENIAENIINHINLNL